MDLTVRFTDHNGVERQVGVQKVVPLNELPLHGLGQPVLVRLASVSPTTKLVISPIVVSSSR
ncbi:MULTISPECIES: hypothetical protein [unclassified Pseudoxanthomonas]|uniref:hypothetical protein n=1 Tax=unclassified Pseudoxanthomonas TaxID=2645906 RepID=UPI003076E53F